MKFLLLALLLLLPVPLYGAAAVDADSVSSCTGCSSLTWNHTVGGSGNLLVCGAHPAHGSATVATYKFNGVGLNLKSSANSGGGTLEMWYLATPATGTHSVELDMGTGSDAIVGGCTSFTGAGALGTAATATGDSSFLTGLSITVPTNGIAYGLGFASYFPSCVNESPDTGNTERYELCADGGSGLTVSGFAASRTTTGIINWTNRPSGAYEAIIAVPIDPSGTAAPARRRIVGIR